jgi:hypothetical protein
MVFANDTIEYLYDASGTKLMQIVRGFCPVRSPIMQVDFSMKERWDHQVERPFSSLHIMKAG